MISLFYALISMKKEKKQIFFGAVFFFYYSLDEKSLFTFK